MNTDHILIFIDYLLIPFIALSIDLRRNKKTDAFSFGAFLLYVPYTVAIYLIVYVMRVVLSRLGVGVNTDAGTGIYTAIATVVALVIPYIREIIVTYVNVRCEIKGKKDSVEK